MSDMSTNAIQAQIDARGLSTGNAIRTAAGVTITGTGAVFTDTNGGLVAGSSVATPFPLVSGTISTAASVLDVRGQATGTANDLMHLTLVGGANATAVIAGYYRVTVTDAAGVITTGDYYAPFYTLG